MLPSIASHAKSHDLCPNRKLGQNFIFDLSLCEKIVKAAGEIKNKTILEIGPGPGGLTRAILSFAPATLIVIEKDRRCIALLEEIKAYYPNLQLFNLDAMNLRLSSFNEPKITIIANLPYNIGTELLFNWLDEIEYVESMTLMLQKEVVDRICAAPGTKEYGKLSIMCQLYADVYKAFDVSKEAFFPPPKVTSSIVNIKPRTERPSQQRIKLVSQITHLAFSQRRKMLKSSLSKICNLSQKFLKSGESPGEFLEKILNSCNINPSLRAENLTKENYLSIACHLENSY